MRKLRAAITASMLVFILSGCQLLGSGNQASDYFDDPAVVDTADAIASGKVKRMVELIEGGVSPNSTGTDGITLLQWAIFEGNKKTLEALLDQGADMEQPGNGGATAVHSAATVKSAEFLKILLERGASPDVRHAETGRTPLMTAMGPRSQEHFEALLEAGADVTLADRTGNTALHIAAMVNAVDQVLTLLEAGADPTALNDQDATFQDYFWRADADIMTDDALDGRRLVAEWLEENGIPLAENARWARS